MKTQLKRAWFAPRDESPLAELTERIDTATASAQGILKKLEENPQDSKALTEEFESLKTTVGTLTTERDEKLRDIELKSLKGHVTTLKGAIDELRKPGTEMFGGGVPIGESDDSPYSQKSMMTAPASFYEDIVRANRGDQEARERMAKAMEGGDQKAMSHASPSAGGYLVPPEVSSDLITLREQATVLRALCSKINVTSDTLQIASVTGGLTAGWVAELAEKPAGDLTFGQQTTSVFTGAGLAVVSNQLLADARPSIDGLISADLAKRLATLEEIALINGTGTGQPRGILNTSGVNSVTLSVTTIPELLDAIFDGITSVQTNYQGNPSHIVMHPRTWNRIGKAREAGAPSTYLIGAGSTAFGRRANDPLPAGELFGLPVILTKNIPTTLGAGTNESRVIVGNFSEALILDRQGITVDESPHVYFTSNQTVFRSEFRSGFTAARYPKAFSVIGGTGLAAG